MKMTKDYLKVIFLSILCLSVFGLFSAPAQLPTAAKSTETKATGDVQAAQKKESLFQKLAKKISQGAKKIPSPKKALHLKEDSAKHVMQVYGWHPSWLGDTHVDYNYNLLTTLSYFSCDIVYNEAQEIEYQLNGWDEPGTAQMIDQARADGCRIDLTVKCQDSKAIDALLNDATEQLNCIQMVLHIVTTAPKADGITLTFDAIPPGNEIQLTQFVKNLHDSLAAKGKTVSITLPAEDFSNSYQVKELAAYIDQFILQGYNYYNKKSGTPGPVAPLDGGFKWNPYDIKRSVNKYVNDGVPKSKLILALPYYGAVWEVDTAQRDPKKRYRFNGHMRYNKVMDHADQHPQSVQYDSVSQSNYYTYTENGKSYVCFYDNGRSLQHKYQWAGEQGLAGVGIWALGFDDGRKDLWQSLAKKISVVKMDSTLTTATAVSDSAALKPGGGSGSGGADGKGGTDAAAADAATPPPPEPTLVEELEAVAKKPKVLTAIVLTLALFSIMGILGSAAFEPVRHKMLITEFSTYLMVQGICVLVFVAFYSMARFLQKEQSAEEYVSPSQIIHWLVLLLILAEMIIHLLSFNLFLEHLRRGKLP